MLGLEAKFTMFTCTLNSGQCESEVTGSYNLAVKLDLLNSEMGKF